MAFFLLI